MLLARFSFVVLIALVLLPTMAVVVDDWLPISPEDMKLTSGQAGGANAVILYHEHTSNDNTDSRFEYYRLKILTEKGKSWADVNIYYSGPEDTVEEIKARTVAPDGTVTPFSGQVFEREVVKGRNLRVRAKSFTLPNVAVGSIIEWRYKEYWDDHHARPARWILQEELMQKHARFSYVPYTGSRGIRTEHGIADGVFFVRIGLPEKAEVKRGINEKMDLELTDIPAYEEEEMSPPADAMKMRVLFYYGSRSMLKPDDYWKEEGKYWTRSVEKFIGHSSRVAQAAQAAVLPADTPAQKTAKVYAFVQGLQNLSYSRPLSGEERKKENIRENTSADSVLEQRSGTRDDLTRLFIAMMNSLNIPTWAMRVAPRSQVFFDPKVPDWRQLGPEIAVVNLGDGKDLFLDPGTPGCPFGILSWSRTAVTGQRQNANGGAELVNTPEPRYSQAVTQRITRLTLEDNGTLKGKILVVYNGQEALQRRLQGLKTDTAGRDKILEDDLKSSLSTEAVVHLAASKGWDTSEGPLSGTFNVELPGFATTTGKRTLVRTAIFQVPGRQAFVHDERKTSVYFPYPYRVVDDIEITLPAGAKVETLPQVKPVSTDFAAYKHAVKLDGDSLEAHRDFAIGGFAFPVSVYRELKTFFAAAQAGDEEQVVLRTGGN